ncbi:hypothetical protein MKQ68_10375 [Chitinophaga horti]|uniref:Uncharacterized protein n=1 Tax=Chitinophaga horti TaxID=2920382 RepID=A0ABY6J761_9BACT|nr:hypothetical protein [Chitinophaga horti]UYQ95505.1 hypothetical protein MKQ68_10375 [Chitinophaga horti]
MLTVNQIFETLKEMKSNEQNFWPQFNSPDVFLISARVNLFRNDRDQWAVIFEKLIFDHVVYNLVLELKCFGNCLKPGMPNYYRVSPVDDEDYDEVAIYEMVTGDERFLKVRRWRIPIILDRDAYFKAGIQLLDPEYILLHEALRLQSDRYGALFHATDKELHRQIPADMEKILVLDEWHHRDHREFKLVNRYESPDVCYGTVGTSLKEMNIALENAKAALLRGETERIVWQAVPLPANFPELDEAWWLFAEVLATGNPEAYKPSLPPNTHWRNWPSSGLNYIFRQLEFAIDIRHA